MRRLTMALQQFFKEFSCGLAVTALGDEGNADLPGKAAPVRASLIRERIH